MKFKVFEIIAGENTVNESPHERHSGLPSSPSLAAPEAAGLGAEPGGGRRGGGKQLGATRGNDSKVLPGTDAKRNTPTPASKWSKQIIYR